MKSGYPIKIRPTVHHGIYVIANTQRMCLLPCKDAKDCRALASWRSPFRTTVKPRRDVITIRLCAHKYTPCTVVDVPNENFHMTRYKIGLVRSDCDRPDHNLCLVWKLREILSSDGC